MNFKFTKERKKKMLSIDEILPSIIQEYGLEGTFLLERIKEGWVNIIGDLMAAHSIPERISHDTLYISVDHPVYSNEILMLVDVIKKRLTKEFGFEAVKKIKIQVKKLKWKG